VESEYKVVNLRGIHARFIECGRSNPLMPIRGGGVARILHDAAQKRFVYGDGDKESNVGPIP
jgi:hypothetical protein